MTESATEVNITGIKRLPQALTEMILVKLMPEATSRSSATVKFGVQGKKETTAAKRVGPKPDDKASLTRLETLKIAGSITQSYRPFVLSKRFGHVVSVTWRLEYQHESGASTQAWRRRVIREGRLHLNERLHWPRWQVIHLPTKQSF